MTTFVTGDTHIPIDVQKLAYGNWPEARGLTKKDHVIVLGDFGLIWDMQESKEEKYWKKWLNERPYTTIALLGNHENFPRLYELPEVDMFGDKVGVISDSIFYLKHGRVYTIDGKTIFVMGGARSIDKDLRTPGRSWWPQEIPSSEDIQLGWDNLEKHNFQVDYVLTHTPPVGFGPYPSGNLVDSFMYTLNDYRLRITFKKWYFGHMHEDHQNHEKFIGLYDKIIQLGDDLI